ncbi:kinase-like domain-containing protein [Flammula alnicola]|nr:kinase-like domain-containing protein [Flammula alnicola]
MSFPEEPLDLPPAEGGGYYPAAIHQKLNGDNYEVVRKLGYGPRSSTWLVLRSHGTKYYVAVKIFTIAASEQAKRVELPILKSLNSIDRDLPLPVFEGIFWEESRDGSHLCVVMSPLSTSVQALQRDAENERLPVHAVQQVVHTAAEALEGLHGATIMHGAIKAENIFFEMGVHVDFLKPILDSEPAPTTTNIKKYVAVQSQPLMHGFRWKDKKKKVVDWPLVLGNFAHAQRSTYKPEKHYDYLSAPETLLGQPSCSPQTDIWMLGYMTFSLLTGKVPFQSNENVSKQIAAMRAVLEDEVPEEWLNDSKMKNYNATDHELVTSIETSLSDVLHKDDAAPAAAFIKSCLRLDPRKRLTATECSDHGWLADTTACSCGFNG